MVNTGKPSPGCYLCRARRVKCDENRPGCYKCKKIGRECPGYRDVNFRFRDETMITIKRAAKSSKRAGQSDDESASSPTEESGSPVAEEKLPLRLQTDMTRRRPSAVSIPSSPEKVWVMDIPNKIDTPISHQATCYFLSSYVLIPSCRGQRGAYTFIHRMISQEAVDPSFAPAFQATSLAALATRPEHRKLRAVAQLHYGKAVQELRLAIADPKRAAKSVTLASILTLALYEMLACPSKTLDEYEAHIRGAMELVKLRGMEQLETAEGMEMVVLTKARFLMLHALPGPRMNMPMNFIPFTETTYSDALGTLGPLINAQRSIRDEVIRLLEGNTTHVDAATRNERMKACFDQSLELATKFQSIVLRCPAQFQPSYIEAVKGFPGSTMYSFTTHWAATFYVTCQGAAIMVLHLMFRCLAFLNSYREHINTVEYGTGYDLTRSAVRNLVAAAHYTTQIPVDGNFDESVAAPPVRTASVMSIFCAAISSEFATDSEQKYLQERLQYLADEGGIAQAAALLGRIACLPRDDIEQDKAAWKTVLQANNDTFEPVGFNHHVIRCDN